MSKHDVEWALRMLNEREGDGYEWSINDDGDTVTAFREHSYGKYTVEEAIALAEEIERKAQCVSKHGIEWAARVLNEHKYGIDEWRDAEWAKDDGEEIVLLVDKGERDQWDYHESLGGFEAIAIAHELERQAGRGMPATQSKWEHIDWKHIEKIASDCVELRRSCSAKAVRGESPSEAYFRGIEEGVKAGYLAGLKRLGAVDEVDPSTLEVTGFAVRRDMPPAPLAELAWRAEPPDQPGWWLLRRKSGPVYAVLFDDELIAFYANRNNERKSYYGPIPERAD